MEEDNEKDSPPADQDLRQGAPAPAETMTPYQWRGNYWVRQSFFILLFRLIGLELGLFLAAGLLFWSLSALGIEGALFSTVFILVWISLSLLIFLLLFLIWRNHYYVLSPKEILSSRGLFFRRTATCDLAAIQSVRVKQNFIQRLFRFGTVHLQLDLGNPDEEKDFLMRNIHNPYQQAKLIDAQRLKETGGVEED